MKKLCCLSSSLDGFTLFITDKRNGHELNTKTNTELKERTINSSKLEGKFRKTILTVTNFLQTTGGSQRTKAALWSYATAENKTRTVEKLNRKRSLTALAPFGECGTRTV